MLLQARAFGESKEAPCTDSAISKCFWLLWPRSQLPWIEQRRTGAGVGPVRTGIRVGWEAACGSGIGVSQTEISATRIAYVRIGKWITAKSP